MADQGRGQFPGSRIRKKCPHLPRREPRGFGQRRDILSLEVRIFYVIVEPLLQDGLGRRRDALPHPLPRLELRPAQLKAGLGVGGVRIQESVEFVVRNQLAVGLDGLKGGRVEVSALKIELGRRVVIDGPRAALLGRESGQVIELVVRVLGEPPGRSEYEGWSGQNRFDDAPI